MKIQPKKKVICHPGNFIYGRVFFSYRTLRAYNTSSIQSYTVYKLFSKYVYIYIYIYMFYG